MTDDILPTKSPAALADRAGRSFDPVTLYTAREIIDTVRRDGRDALRSYTMELDGRAETEPLFLDPSDLLAAWNTLEPDERDRLDRITGRIESFAVSQLGALSGVSVSVPGGRAGHDVEPVETAGCYAPGGRYPLPSTVLMTAVTARVAGVSDVWLATPSTSPMMLAAAHVAGVDGVLAAGGAQAIAALAYGVDPVPPCDVIVGPGNRYVTAAKYVIAGDVRIDMLAGPSELVIIADDSANPALIAADLLAQAEHDSDAFPALITTDAGLVRRVQEQLRVQLETLPTADVAREALANGGVCVVKSMYEAVELSDRIAPEHVQVCTRDWTEREDLRHYGGLFLGEHSPEVLGDYGVGPNHVLPTSGAARSTGGLSVLTFLRVRTWLNCDAGQLDPLLCEDVAWLARVEGLEAHARAAEARA